MTRNDGGAQYLEDLATAYWRSEVLFTAVERDIFSHLGPDGCRTTDLAKMLGFTLDALNRLCRALETLGLVGMQGDRIFNTKISRRYLVKGEPAYQGESILWRRRLAANWNSLTRCLEQGTRTVFPPTGESVEAVNERFCQYSRAMDTVARTKAAELMPIIAGLPLKGRILDVGSGLGALSEALLETFPSTRATLLDMPQVLELASATDTGRKWADRLEYVPADLLEHWPVQDSAFRAVILSNIVHAFGEAETRHVLSQAADCLTPDGILLIHDFFFEHQTEKASLSDLNMLVNTYNGRVYAAEKIRKYLHMLGLTVSGLIRLESDTALLAAAPAPETLTALRTDPIQRLSVEILALGFDDAREITPGDIAVPGWTEIKCRFGCDSYNSPHCPPNSLSAEKTREILGDFRRGLLLKGVPPTADFQRSVLKAERQAFRAGYYKAFGFWAGPCTICETCTGTNGDCVNPKNARPSMESAGIDVFRTVREAGYSLETLPNHDDYVNYFALLLLE